MRLLVVALLPIVSHADDCRPRITSTEAIRIAKREFDKQRVDSASAWYKWAVQRRDCTWLVIGHTPPDAWSGDAHVDVDAQSGKAIVYPILRTDPRKIPKKPHQASNQALERTATVV
jgi:hypothetical protein